MRLGQDEKGLESLKGGITLLARESRNGYLGYEDWDLNGLVRTAMRRTVLLVAKGLEEKQNLMAATERLLIRIDDEEHFQRRDVKFQERKDRGGPDD